VALRPVQTPLLLWQLARYDTSMATTSAPPSTAAASFADAYRTQLFHALNGLDLQSITECVDILRSARDEGRSIFVCGNGGSAATASHFATDMVKGASYGYASRFRIMALTDSASTITAYANDVSYDSVFVEQLKNFAKPGDVFIAISGSGNSPNVVEAIEYANSIGCKTIAMTGKDGGKLKPAAAVQLHIDDKHMGRIEDAHMVVCHMLAYCFMEQAV
jgi:D-sedoheptulose 7-phosphate isomerase